jgi:anti-sigma-K factor RskA
MMDHDALRELTGAYALGTLSEAERRGFEAHLDTCPECTAEVRAFSLVAEGLGQLVEPRDPPPHLRARVLAIAGAPAAPIRREKATLPPWLLLAASIALIAVGTYAVLLRGRVHVADQSVTRVAEILGASDVRRVDLAGQAVAPAASGRTFWSPSRGMMFTAADLPPLPGGQVYQLWLVTASAPWSAGLFTPDRTGRAIVIGTVPAGVQPVAVAVTIEPAGGVPSPTGAKYLVGTL